MTSKPIEDTIRAITTILAITLILMWLAIITLAWQVTQRHDTYWASGLIATPITKDGGK